MKLITKALWIIRNEGWLSFWLKFFRWLEWLSCLIIGAVFLPSGTRRRKYFELGRSGVGIIKNEGWSSFLNKFGEWRELTKAAIATE